MWDSSIARLLVFIFSISHTVYNIVSLNKTYFFRLPECLKMKKLINTNETHPALFTICMYKGKGRAAEVQHRNRNISGTACGIAQTFVVCVGYYINHRLHI